MPQLVALDRKRDVVSIDRFSNASIGGGATQADTSVDALPLRAAADTANPHRWLRLLYPAALLAARAREAVDAADVAVRLGLLAWRSGSLATAASALLPSGDGGVGGVWWRIACVRLIGATVNVAFILDYLRGL